MFVFVSSCQRENLNMFSVYYMQPCKEKDDKIKVYVCLNIEPIVFEYLLRHLLLIYIHIKIELRFCTEKKMITNYNYS